MTLEERQQMRQKWQGWLGDGLRKGWVLNAGDKLQQERRVVKPTKVITDGPFVETKEAVAGFSIVQAETLDDAAELAKGCPILLVGGTVEVGPLEGITITK
jgi:hypothetical protein